MRLPCPLVNILSPIHNSLAEIFGREIVSLQYFSGFGCSSHYRGLAANADSLIEYSVEIEEALGITVGRVRIRCHDLVPVDGRSVRKSAGMVKQEQCCLD